MCRWRWWQEAQEELEVVRERARVAEEELAMLQAASGDMERLRKKVRRRPAAGEVEPRNLIEQRVPPGEALPNIRYITLRPGWHCAPNAPRRAPRPVAPVLLLPIAPLRFLSGLAAVHASLDRHTGPPLPTPAHPLSAPPGG
jgi:hypothetical protein